MKLLLVLALIGCTAAIDWKWCGDDTYKGKISTVTSSPDPPEKGKNNTIEGKGQTLVDIPTGEYELILKVDGVKLLDKKGDICKPATINLPLGSGTMYMPGFNCPAKANDPITQDLYVSLSPSAPAGNSESILYARLSDGTGLLCAQVSFKIPGDRHGNWTMAL